jgi:hypothetical protein
MGRATGLGLFVISLLMYRSYSARPVLGMWSYSFAGIVLIAIVLFMLCLLESLRRVRSRTIVGVELSTKEVLFDLAILVNAIAYLISSIDNRVNAGRILYANLWGSIDPSAALLEYVALLFWVGTAGYWIVPRLNSGLRRAVVVFGAVAVTLLAAEGVARVRVTLEPEPQGYSSFASDLWARRYVELNQSGFRDSEHSVQKDPAIHRLLILGDSYAFGWGIKQIDGRCGERLAALLQLHRGEYWEVINASRPDTHTLDHIGFLEQFLKFKPDAAILFYVFNDIDYIAMVTPRDNPRAKGLAGRLHPAMLLFTNSYLYHEILVRSRLLYYQVRERKGVDSQADPYFNSTLLAKHLGDLGRLVSMAEDHGVPMGVVPFDERVVLGGVHKERYTMFVKAAEMLDIPIWDPSEGFRGYDYSSLIVNNLDRHPNETANRAVAESVVPHLLESLKGTVSTSLTAKRSRD